MLKQTLKPEMQLADGVGTNLPDKSISTRPSPLELPGEGGMA